MNFFQEICSIENILDAWCEFSKGKHQKKDVQEFQLHLMDNILLLNKDLLSLKYKHGKYESFNINDPKPRNIHKASVRDRLLHHAIYRVLYPYFDKKFIDDSYSCRLGKGTHKALNQLKSFINKSSQNNSRRCFVLKCDIRKFFASIDHKVLEEIVGKSILDFETGCLIKEVVESFYSFESGKGLPLGNLTSQLLVNIYMDQFDQYMKHIIKTKYYIRYADDFIVLSHKKEILTKILEQTQLFLIEELKLNLHPNKVFIKTLASGVDFLGWVHFHDHRVLRTTTKRRMFRNLDDNPSKETIQSYLGLLSHGSAYKLQKRNYKFFETSQAI